MSKPIIFLIDICIFLGDLTILLIQKTGQLILKFFFFFKKTWFKIKIKVASPFKKSKTKQKNFLSLNNYLFFYRVKYFAFGFLIALGMFSFSQALDFINRLPSLSMLENNQTTLSTHIYDRNGKLLYEIYREQNRTPVKLSELPVYIKQATISIEDKDFYKHKGVSVFGGILRAVKETYLRKKLQGGSTITQQLVKSALLTPERTIERKIKEVILAMLVERKYSKEQILEMYLNQVPYGGTAWGIEEAAKLYFGKSAKNLSLPEAALLSGLPQAPSIYSPYTNPKLALSRQQEVLFQMYKEKFITQEQYVKYKQEKLTFKKPNTSILAPHFVFFVKEVLEQEYGLKTVTTGGLKVYTTLDYNIQKETEKILKAELDKIASLNVGNGAILVTRPSTGEILAMVGSKNFFDGNSGAYNVTTALRQPGSSIKPLNYLLGLKRGLTAATIINDSPVRFVSGSEVYSPVNYDGSYHGNIPLRYALANSYNIPAVKVLEMNGVDNFINFAKRLGITTWEENRGSYGLSLTLGGGEVTMLDLATGYGVIANLGIKENLSPIARIENSIGQVIYEHKPDGERVINEEEPFIISDILADNVARSLAFGSNSPLNFGNGYVSVKTGTTDMKKDNWTIGFTRPTQNSKYPDALVAVWVGNNDNQPMNPALTSGITGAAPIWRAVIEKIVNPGLFSETLFIPKHLEAKSCYFGRTEYFIEGTSSKANCYFTPFKPTETPKP